MPGIYGKNWAEKYKTSCPFPDESCTNTCRQCLSRGADLINMGAVSARKDTIAEAREIVLRVSINSGYADIFIPCIDELDKLEAEDGS